MFAFTFQVPVRAYRDEVAADASPQQAIITGAARRRRRVLSPRQLSYRVPPPPPPTRRAPPPVVELSRIRDFCFSFAFPLPTTTTTTTTTSHSLRDDPIDSSRSTPIPIFDRNDNDTMSGQREPRLFSPMKSARRKPDNSGAAGDDHDEEDFALPRIPTHLQGEQRPAKAAADSTQAGGQPVFGTASPLRNPFRAPAPTLPKRDPKDPFMPARRGPRPEHHKAPVHQPYFNPANSSAHRAPHPAQQQAYRAPAPAPASVPMHAHEPEVDAFEATGPPGVTLNVSNTVPTQHAAPKPIFSTKSGFKAVNSWKAPGAAFVNHAPPAPAPPKTDEDDGFDPNKALEGDKFGASDPYNYVDSAQANENIKALLEAAFEEDDEDKPRRRLRSRKSKQSSEVDQLADAAKELSIKGEAKGAAQEDEEDDDDDDEGHVEGLSVRLLPHQSDGVTWMLDKEIGSRKKNGVLPKGGILADDMGLGKTIQALALVMSNRRPDADSAEAKKRKISDKVGKGTLVVAPLALIKQWESEISDKVERLYRLKVLVHHGSSRTRDPADLAGYDVVITTYQTLSSEHGDSSDKENGPKVGCMGVHWYRLIMDEAHTIKNRNAKMTKAACELKSLYRWCLTGTPMQNNLDELQSLIHFLRIKPYSELSSWNEQISAPMKNGRGGLAMKRLQYFLKAFMKRRTKDILNKEGALDFGKPKEGAAPNPGFKIVERRVESVVLQFTPSERKFYDSVAARTERSIEAMLANNRNDYIGALVMLLRLRQICNHRLLIRRTSQWDIATQGGTGSDTQTPSRRSRSSGGTAAAVAAADDDLAAMMGGLSVAAKKCDVCQADLSAGEMEGGGVHCAECAADMASLGPEKSLTRPKPKSKRRLVRKKAAGDDKYESDEEEEGEWIVSADQRTGTALGKASGSDDEDAEGGGESLGEDDSVDDDDEESIVKTGRVSQRKSDVSQGSTLTGEEDVENSKYYSTDDDEQNDSSEDDVDADDDDVAVRIEQESSTKILKLLEILARETPEHKTIVFSEFTSMLDLIEPYLRAAKHSFVRYDGSMRPDAREASLASLRKKHGARVLLCSLKSGSLGLNLTVASRVVLMEPFWNPFVEEQAIDRVHRLNQTRDVVVYKLTVQDTVEERILDLQAKKRELARTAIEGGKSMGKLDMKDILGLFHRDAENVQHPGLDLGAAPEAELRFMAARNHGAAPRARPKETKGGAFPVDPAYARRW